MQRGSASLLSRLTLRAPLARVALPLLAALVPGAFSLRSACACSLHVFARRRSADYAKVEVGDAADAGDLKDAVIAKLKLGAPPDSVRLLREVEGGGAPVPLDSRRALAGQGVQEGSSVLVEVLPPPLPPALPYVLVRLGGSLVPTKVAFAPGADADDLKGAVIAKLKLDTSPTRVRLLREVEGGAAVPLTSFDRLSDQGVEEGSEVLVEVIAPAPAPAAAPPAAALPAPLTFAQESVGGELMMVASLPLASSLAAPFYLTPLEHHGLASFLEEPPSIAPQMLMLTGPVKSGKSRIVHDVLPRMLAARYAAAPTTVRRPVIFRHTFILGVAENAAAEGLVTQLQKFALGEGIPLAKPAAPFIVDLPHVAAELAQGVHRAGGELWLLFDELGAPIVASTPAGASLFTQQLKTLVEKCSFYARTVGTGSGMVALLTAIRAARPNGFVLWDAIAHVSLGREPAPPAALAMAQGILTAYATKWPPAVARTVTPQAVLALLACSAHSQLTSPRPALVACLASLMGSARGSGASPDLVLTAAVDALLRKLREESARDTAIALERMPVQMLKTLRALAVHGLAPDQHNKATAGFIALLCETGSPLQLLPPYSALLRSWVTRDGQTCH
jgi:hypothetical protein